jgi:hypothetical protein
MLGKIASHQLPHETGGTKNHDVQFTVPAHQFILKKRPIHPKETAQTALVPGKEACGSWARAGLKAIRAAP